MDNKKEDIIAEIIYRIKQEYKKYHNNDDLDWMEIAARKIYASHFNNKIGTGMYDIHGREAFDGDIIQDNNGNLYEVYWDERYQWSKRNYPKNEYRYKNFQGSLTSSNFIVPLEMKWEIINMEKIN